MAAEKPTAPRKMPAAPIRMQLAEQMRNIYRLIVPNEAQLKDVLEPGFYVHLAKKLRPGDRIEIKPDDGSYFAEVEVQDVGGGYAKVALLREVKLETVTRSAASILPGHSTEWGGEHIKWRVIRESDRRVLKDQLPTQTDALNWLSNHAKAQAA